MPGLRARAGPSDEAASPLAVIVVIALVAAGLTALVFFAVVDVTGPDLALQQVEREDGGRAFQVTQVRGDLAWGALTVQLLDPSGADHAGFYLEWPAGDVAVGQLLVVRSALPAGTWLLRITEGGDEIVRLATVV